MASRPDPYALRVANERIRAMVERDLDRIWLRIWSREANPVDIRDALLRVTPTLVERYGDMAGAFAADWYEGAREAARVRGGFSALPQPSPYEDAIEGTVRRLAGDLWTDHPEAMLAGLKGRVGKYALAAGRETVTRAAFEDPQAVGYQRVTRRTKGGPCKFCTMLAGRGGVYKEATAFFASHNDCNCAAVPSWDADAPEVDVRAYVASVRTTAMTPTQREEHNRRIQGYLAEMSD